MPYTPVPGDRVTASAIYPASPPAGRKFYVPRLDMWFPMTTEEHRTLALRTARACTAVAPELRTWGQLAAELWPGFTRSVERAGFALTDAIPVEV